MYVCMYVQKTILMCQHRKTEKKTKLLMIAIIFKHMYMSVKFMHYTHVFYSLTYPRRITFNVQKLLFVFVRYTYKYCISIKNVCDCVNSCLMCNESEYEQLQTVIRACRILKPKKWVREKNGGAKRLKKKT